MMVDTSAGGAIDSALLNNYFAKLVDSFFKILPMREAEQPTLPIYMRNLQMELLGLRDFVPELQEDTFFLTLLSILEYLINNETCSVVEVKRQIFRSISLCNKLKAVYVKHIPEKEGDDK